MFNWFCSLINLFSPYFFSLLFPPSLLLAFIFPFRFFVLVPLTNPNVPFIKPQIDQIFPIDNRFHYELGRLIFLGGGFSPLLLFVLCHLLYFAFFPLQFLPNCLIWLVWVCNFRCLVSYFFYLKIFLFIGGITGVVLVH